MRGKLSAYNLPAQHYGLWRALLDSGLHYGLWRALLDVGSVEYSSTLPRRLTAQNPPQPHTAAPWCSVWDGSGGRKAAPLTGAAAPVPLPGEVCGLRGVQFGMARRVACAPPLVGLTPHTPDCPQFVSNRGIQCEARSRFATSKVRECTPCTRPSRHRSKA